MLGDEGYDCFHIFFWVGTHASPQITNENFEQSMREISEFMEADDKTKVRIRVEY